MTFFSAGGVVPTELQCYLGKLPLGLFMGQAGAGGVAIVNEAGSTIPKLLLKGRPGMGASNGERHSHLTGTGLMLNGKLFQFPTSMSDELAESFPAFFL